MANSNANIKMKNSDLETLLIELKEMFNRLNDKIDIIIESNDKILHFNEELLQKIGNQDSKKENMRIEPDTMALLSLPSALRKTAMVLYRLEQATADELANETKRLRAVESAAANELVRMGYIKKKRIGRDVYFYIEVTKES